jgi:hypothetical protein
MYTVLCLLVTGTLVAVEITSGVAIMGFNLSYRIRRTKTPGPFWFIIGLHVFLGICGAAVIASIEYDLR